MTYNPSQAAANHRAQLLSARFGVHFIGELKRDLKGSHEAIRAADIDAPNGFSVLMTAGWRSVEASFLPDTYAGRLIRTMGNASSEAKSQFSQLCNIFADRGNRLQIRVNDAITDPNLLPSGIWNKFELVVRRMTDATDDSGPIFFQQAEEVTATCMALALSLIPLEETADSSTTCTESGLPEGAKTRIEVNRYERSPINRAACIAIYGARCYVCTLDFAEMYGDIGEGFIEVHHRVPISKMAGEYVVDPRRDLIPLCSNCHSMVHRHDPPMSVDELKQRLRPVLT